MAYPALDAVKGGDHAGEMDLFFNPQVLGQIVGFIALALCIVAFASKNDDRLLAILILGNVAFATQFALFGAWTASAITALIILRIILARRMPGSVPATVLFVCATAAVAAVTWEEATDIFPLVAGIVGTIAMFMLRGIAMRIALAVAALCWAAANAYIGSVGALAAELLVFATNAITIVRIARDRRRLAAPAE